MRDTTTGMVFENKVSLAERHKGAINLTKHNLYRYLKEQGVKWQDIISAKLLPDEAYLDGNTLYVYEKKFQRVEGSADEKPQTCGFKIWEFEKIGRALGVEEVKYIYILSDWFKKPKYKDMLEYIEAMPGCGYEFEK